MAKRKPMQLELVLGNAPAQSTTRYSRWVAGVPPDYEQRRRTLRQESRLYLLACASVRRPLC